ncbi:hypothetical protein ACOTJH_30470, partial [Achromobacter xylosoxidans]
MTTPKKHRTGVPTIEAAPARAAGDSNVADYLGAVISDAFSMLCVPGASVLGAAAKAALQARQARRAEEARDILLDELRAGQATPHAVELEESSDIALRYARAVREGVGRINR